MSSPDANATAGARAFPRAPKRSARRRQASDLLRLLAIAIAVAAIVDPAVTVTGATRARIAVVNLEPGSSDAARAADALVRDLRASFDVQRQISSDIAAAVVVGRSYPADPLPGAFPVATVTIPDAAGVRIVRVTGPREVPPATSIHLEVDVEGPAVAGQTTEVSARVGGMEVARASHRWVDDRERWRAALDAVPTGDPPYVVHVQAGAASADVVVGVRARPLRVEFYDPRPSWATTFVRRALEGDARFQVESLSFSSRGVAARTAGESSLTDPRLDSFDAVVVGGLERLSSSDVRALDRYMRERGGGVVLAPDERVNEGPARDLVPVATERLLERPAKLVSTRVAASLQASEMLVVRADAAGADVLAATPGQNAEPVIVSMPRGAGRLVVSGAMDAWRFRAAEEAAFDRFWQSVVAGLALAAAPALDVSVTPAILRPGDRADVIVRMRGRRDAAVSASVDAQPLRLWPEAEAGVYRGRFVAQTKTGRSLVEARAAPGADASAASIVVPIERDARPAEGDVFPALSMLAASRDGIDATPDRLADVERFVRDRVSPRREPATRHPMRSTWWIVPFAGLLSADWWLRRRRGLK
jgi:hypothetical protein